jgi:hypothetical protein
MNDASQSKEIGCRALGLTKPGWRGQEPIISPVCRRILVLRNLRVSASGVGQRLLLAN